jgi:Fe-S cluster assembly protein SufD
MNTALMSDGAFIFVPSNKKVENPIIIVNVLDSSDMNVLSQPRNLIVLEKNADACIVESYLSIGANASFTNVVNEIYANENAHLEHYKIQQQVGETYHNNYTQIFQEANTNINQVTLTLDGTMVRNNLHFYMNGKNCDTLLYGLYITEKSNHVDNHTRVDHAMPNCQSNELYKGIMKDKSTGVFNGKIMVHLDAQKTNAYQRNQNILLDENAAINTKPQLEIFADDVKCTHGATIGQLDEEPMFYLRSRGIPEDVARKMLLNAFADDIAEKIKIPELVGLLEQLIDEKL